MIERFWSKVAKGEGLWDCWEWTATRDGHGYGFFSVGRNMERSHRVAWAMANGPIPTGMLVLHACDNPPCVRPAHLFLGTQADNNADRDAKGRHVSLVGQQHGMSRLTDDAVRVIRSGGESLSVLAARFGVTKQAIAYARKGTTWRHVS